MNRRNPLSSSRPLLVALVVIVSGGLGSRALANSAPVVSNVTAHQRTDGSRKVDIRYNLADADGNSCTVTVQVSNDTGATWTVPATALTGAVGSGVAPGSGKLIVWDCKVDLPGAFGTQFKARVCASPGPVVLQPGPNEAKDIWTTSVYSNAPGDMYPGGGLDNEYLIVGGWGDEYYSLLEFDLSHLPSHAQTAVLSLNALPQSEIWWTYSTPTGMYLDCIIEFWDWRTQGTGRDRERLWWADRPSTVQWNQNPLPPPSRNTWYDIDITTLYNDWQSGARPHYGLQLRPTSTWNTFNIFRSSEFAEPSLRPKLTVMPDAGGTGSGHSGLFAIDNRSGSGTLTGLVVGLNAQGQAQGPLAGAAVSVPGLGNTTTNGQGGFTFAAVPEGTYDVTASMSGYMPSSKTVTITSGQNKSEMFQLTIQSANAPVASNFASPNGKHFIEGMPGNLAFSTDVAWNGPPGSVRFNIAGTWYPATVSDLGGGMARASLSVAAPAALGACTELTIEVTNGEGKKTYVNTGVHFSPVPGIIVPWYQDNIPWTPSGGALTYSESTQNASGFLPDGFHVGPMSIESFGARQKKLTFDPLAARFSGDFLWSLGAKFKTDYVPVFGCPLRGLGEARGSWGGGLDISVAGCDSPTVSPYWHLGFSGKAGAGVPVVVFVEPVIPPAAAAINLLLGIPVVCDVVGALEMRFYIVFGADWTGAYPDGQLGDDPLFLYAKTVNGTATVGPEAQCVLELYKAYVGVYVGGTAALPIELPLRVTKVRGYAGVFAGYLLFQYKTEYGVEFSFDDGPAGQPARITALSPLRGNNVWEPIGTDLKRWGQSNRLVSTKNVLVLAAESAAQSGGSSEEVLVENVTKISTPSVVADANEAVITYAAFDSAKPWYAATDIGTLRQVGGGAWSLSRIADDTDAEFSPQIVGVDGTTDWAAWERVSGDVSGATGPGDIAPHLEIVTSRFDRTGGTWSAPLQLTSNAVVDRDPETVVFGSKQGILWIQNQAGDSPGNATNGDSLLFAEWNGTAYETAQTLWSGQKGILNLAFAADSGGQGHVVFAVDEDGDNETKTDRELYAIATLGGAWQSPARLTNDAVEDAVPVLIAVNGTPICVWSAGGTVSYTALGMWNPRAVYSEYTTANDAVSLDGVVLPGGAAIAYTVQTSEGVNIVASFYDAALDKWSLPRQLTQDEHAESALSLACDGTDLVIAYLKTQTERNEVDVEIDGVVHHLTNVPQPARTDLYVLRHSLGYDLAVGADSVTVDPPNPPPGSAAIISVTVENRGDLGVQNSQVAFYDGDPNGGGTLIGTVQVPDLLVGGASRQVSVEWSTPLSGPTGVLFVVADPNLVLEDRDRSNNAVSLASMLPDLVVKTGWDDAVSMDSVAITTRIVNQGSLPSGPADLSWRLGAADGPEIGRTTIEPLSAGGAYEAVLIWNTQGRTPGEFVQVTAVIDNASQVQEWDESNNAGAQAVHIPAPIMFAAADLNQNRYVDSEDLGLFLGCARGPAVPHDQSEICQQADLADHDNDVDQEDFGIFQRCYSGDELADPACAN